MALVLKLPPNGRVIVNGCVIRNAPRVQAFHVENKADIILEKNIATPEAVAGSLAGSLYRMLQTALLAPGTRATLMPEIQGAIARLCAVFRDDLQINLIEAATHVSAADYYAAMRCIKPVWARETELRARFGDLMAPEEVLS